MGKEDHTGVDAEWVHHPFRTQLPHHVGHPGRLENAVTESVECPGEIGAGEIANSELKAQVGQEDHEKACPHHPQGTQLLHEVSGQEHARQHGDERGRYYDTDTCLSHPQVLQDDRQEGDGRVGKKDEEGGRRHEEVVPCVAFGCEDSHRDSNSKTLVIVIVMVIGKDSNSSK